MEYSTALTQKDESRSQIIDIAKGVLIIAVVFSHTWFANVQLLADYFPYAMPAFFFLSGYTYNRKRTYFSNISRRFIRLVVPYICFGAICNLLYPVYLSLSKTLAAPGAYKTLWIASLKVDAINMLMSTPMWFLAALFTASIIFFIIVDATQDNILKTSIAALLLLAVAVIIDIYKKDLLPWFIDLAPYAAAFMIIGAYFGNKKLFSKLSLKSIIIGILLLAVSYYLNSLFPGSAKTSVVSYIEPKKWYGVLTAFCIGLCGSLGVLSISGLLSKVPVIRKVLAWSGKNSIWILCIHYCVIMLVELVLFNKGILSNSINQVVAVELFGYGHVSDTKKDIIIKIAIAVLSIVISGIYALIHNYIKGKIKGNNKT